MTGYQSKKLLAQSREDDLVKRLREYCDGNNDLMDAAADRIEQLEKALRKIADCATLPAQNDIEMREIARAALGEKKDAD